MLRDGLYALRFAASHDGEPQEATGLAVLRDGTVIGSDPAGAAFTGTYEYDASRDLNRVRLRVDIAPDGVLVTGFDAGPEGTALDVVGAFSGVPTDTAAYIQIAGAPLGVKIQYLGPPPS
jgi:hypothetical protein